MRQRIETPSTSISKASYFRPSVMISRLRRITRVSDCKSSRIAISSGVSVTNRLSFRVSGLATRGFAVVGRSGMPAPNHKLIRGSTRRLSPASLGHRILIEIISLDQRHPMPASHILPSAVVASAANGVEPSARATWKGRRASIVGGLKPRCSDVLREMITLRSR